MITHSTWAQAPIKLTEGLGDNVWKDAGKMPIPGGYLMTKNDHQFLYVALDMVEDKVFDAETSDYFWFTHDRNCDGEIMHSEHLNYDLYSGFPEKTVQQFCLATGTWAEQTLDSDVCKMAFEGSPNETSAHRIWKLRFNLSDLNISLNGTSLPLYAKFGLKIYFANHTKYNDLPVNFYHNFSGIHKLYFSRKPSLPLSFLGRVIESMGLQKQMN